MDYVAATSKGEKYAGYLEDTRTVQADRDMVARVSELLEDVANPFVRKLSVEGVENPFRTSTSGEMVAALSGQLLVINALATYKQWKIDNGYGNSDTYDKIGDRFRKDHKYIALIIDQL